MDSATICNKQNQNRPIWTGAQRHYAGAYVLRRIWSFYYF